MRGKTWPFDEEMQLRQLVAEGNSVADIASLMQKTPVAVSMKIVRLGLEVVDDDGDVPPTLPSSSSSLELPENLPSVEEVLRLVAAALVVASKPGLSKVEVQRLQVLGGLSKAYREGATDYLRIRDLEVRLEDMTKKYEEMVEEHEKLLQKKLGQTGQDDASGSVCGKDAASGSA